MDSTGTCSDAHLAALKKAVAEEIDALAPRLIGISDDIHAHPEIRFEERYAAKLLADTLEGGGLAVERGTAGMETAFKGETGTGQGGPAVAILGEYDALPVLGHACGHNIMGTAAVGAGLALAKVMSGDAARAAGLNGRLLVLGTPAEEGGGGKVIMLREGVLEGVDAALIVHPGNANRAHAESIASFKMDIRFHGRPAHAAASPHQGINALDALVLTYSAISALRQQLKPDVRIHGIITKGGDAPNIIPELTEGSFIIRSADKAYNQEVIAKVKDCARGAALQTGATVEFVETGIPYDPMKSNTVLEDLHRHNMGALGLSEPAEPRRGAGSTDMGNISQALPAIHPSIAIGPATLVGHTREMCDASRSEEGHRAVINAAKCMAMTALDLFLRPELVEKAWAEFRG
ncbi:MAG: M20 family metallopeptidase [Bacillota bacterium]|nr:M20 family metallopeptidase [Bacillota bacterium]